MKKTIRITGSSSTIDVEYGTFKYILETAAAYLSGWGTTDLDFKAETLANDIVKDIS